MKRKLYKRWIGLSGSTRGIIWAILAAVFMSMMAALIKFLGTQMSSFQIVWFRAFFGLILIIPFIGRAGGISSLSSEHLSMHLVRGGLGVAAMLSGFYAVTVLPLTLVTTLGFSRPLFMVPLAIIFLNEIVRVRRWSATIVGFIGVLVAIRPTSEIEIAAFIALFSSLMVALAMIVTKKLSTTETPITMMFYQGLLASILALIPCIYFWKTPSFYELALLGLLAIFASLSTNFMIRALKVGEATVVTPVEYIRIIFASAIGFFVFTEIPSFWTLAGSIIIVFSTVYIALREARLGYQKSISTIDS